MTSPTGDQYDLTLQAGESTLTATVTQVAAGLRALGTSIRAAAPARAAAMSASWAEK